jgi:hypothetical protein
VSGAGVIWSEALLRRGAHRANDLASNGLETEAQMDQPASKHLLAFRIIYLVGCGPGPNLYRPEPKSLLLISPPTRHTTCDFRVSILPRQQLEGKQLITLVCTDK